MFALLVFAGLPSGLCGQNKNDLEERRKKLIRDIAVTDKLLKKTTQNKEATFDRFIALQSQIERRETLISTLDEEIAELEQNIERSTGVVASLTRDIQVMKEEYGQFIRNAYRRKALSNPLLYIFSAESLNQAFRRWLFLRKYDNYRKEQAEAIEFTQKMLARKIENLEQTRKRQEGLLVSLQGQKTMLSTELSDKEVLLKTLEKDESRLRSDLQKKQETHEALNQAIERIIQEEIRRKVEESRRPKPAPPAPKPATPSPPVASTGGDGNSPASEANDSAELPDDGTSLAFRQNRGRLPWPVDNGFIARAFGRQKHPTLRNIEITNNGIDIRTDESASVRAIYEGKVAGVQFIPGHDYTVILQHGNYYTVYSNLSETPLAKGQRVRAQQTIGRVSANPITSASELHFELWYQKERLNPAAWIK